MTFRSKLLQQLKMWWPAGLVLLIGAALSFSLYQVLEKRQSDLLQDRVEQQAQLFTSAIEHRLYVYADYLRGMASLLEAKAQSSQDVIQLLRDKSGAVFRYPGVDVVSVIRKREASDYAQYREQLLRDVPARQRVDEQLMPDLPLSQTEYFVVEDVWPQAAQGALVGVDAGQHKKYQSQIQTFEEGLLEPVISAPQPFSEGHETRADMLLSVPLHTNEKLKGTLNISLRIEDVVEHFRARGILKNIHLKISDITNGQNPEVAYDDLYSKSFETSPRLGAQKQLHILGREWVLEFEPNGSVLSPAERWFPTAIAAGTLGTSLLLAGVVGLLVRQRARAQAHANIQDSLLRQHSDRLKALFHQTAIGVAEIDPLTGQVMSSNARFEDIVGNRAYGLEDKSLHELVHEDDREKCLRLEQQLFAGRLPHFNITQRIVREDGRVIWVDMWQSPLLGVDDKPIGRYFVLMIDVTERCVMEEQLHAREAYSSEMLRYMPVGLVVVGPVGNIEFVNHQFEVMTGWAQSDMSDESNMWRHLCVDVQQHAALLQRLNVGRCQVVATGVNMPTMEYLLRSKDGRELAMEVSGRFLGGRILLSFVDVSQRKAAEEEIRWLGYYDTLTQLPNRRLLLDRLEEAIARGQRSGGHKGALLLLDIDNFKSLNETLGHDHGDALLRLVATRLSGCIVGHHTLARQGGDEFAVVLEDLPVDPLEAGRCTELAGGAILKALRTPFYLNNQDFHVTVSMGAVVFSGQGDSVEELLKRADLALYQAKSAGRDTLQFFDPSMQKAVSARVEMEKDMRMALERHEFDLFFQPQVQHDKVIGAEALLRWNHPTKGFIPPSLFVPAAEESGLIFPLGEWVLYAACRQLAHWAQDNALSSLTMSVNVSPRQFYQTNFVEQVQQALQVTGAKPSLLELELTEGMLLTDVDDTIRKMVQLKAMGVIFSLDDFGTGYSSLSYLKRLPLDKLKIDQSFVREVESSVNDAAIARSIIALGHSLGLQVIAEGVETEAQRAFLAANGCSYWQGFYFSRPQPANKFEAWVHSYGTRFHTESEITF